MIFKRLTAFTLSVALMSGVLAGCGSNGDKANESSGAATSTAANIAAAVSTGTKLEEVTLKMLVPDTKSPKYDETKALVEEKIKDTINAKIDVTLVSWGDIGNKTQLALAAGDNIDLIFDAPWLHMNQMIAAGYYEELTDLVNKYGQDILKTRSKNMMEANMFDGKLMGIPNGNSMVQPHGYNIRKDLREKLGMSPITTYDELEKYLYAVKEKFPDIIPAWADGAPGNSQYTWAGWRANDDAETNIRYTDAFSANLMLYYKGNDGKVYNLFETNEPKVMSWIENARKLFKDKVLDNDLAAKKDQWADYQAGKVACQPVRSFEIHYDFNDKCKAATGGEYEPVTLMDFTPGKIILNLKQDNFICIPKISKNKERAMMFLNWCQENEENYYLASQGVEGEKGSYRFVGEDRIESITANQSGGLAPDFDFIKNPAFVKYNTKASEESVKKLKFIQNGDNFIKGAEAGFTFNSEPVKNEIAQFNAIAAKYYSVIFNGMVDTDEYMAKFKKEGGDVLKKVQDELQKQLDAHVAKSK